MPKPHNPSITDTELDALARLNDDKQVLAAIRKVFAEDVVIPRIGELFRSRSTLTNEEFGAQFRALAEARGLVEDWIFALGKYKRAERSQRSAVNQAR